MTSSDLIILDLTHSSFSDAEFALLNCNKETNKTVIVISSLNVWERCPFAEYNEDDYKKRQPSVKYLWMKAIEELALTVSAKSPNIKSYILCCGVVYGKGEEPLLELYKRGWLGKPIPTHDANSLPLIHIDDVVQMVVKLSDNTQKKKYYLGVTSNEKVKQISEAIANSLGNGSTEIVGRNIVSSFNFNLIMKPTDMLQSTSSAGLSANIKIIVNEFMKCRGLKRIALLIQGPPATTKTTYAANLSKYFNLPHIQINTVIENAKKGKDGETIIKMLEEEKKKMVDEIEALIKKKKKVETDPSKVVPKLPDAFVVQLFKKRIQEADCQMRGFILDGYPKTYVDTLRLFTQSGQFTEEMAQTQTEEEFLKSNPIDTKAVPNCAILLSADDEYILSTIKAIPPEKSANTHYTEELTKKRLEKYHTNNPTDGSGNLEEFLKEKAIPILPFNLATSKEDENIKAICAYLEKDGKVSTFEPKYSKIEIKLEGRKQVATPKEYYIKTGKRKLSQLPLMKQKSSFKPKKRSCLSPGRLC